MPSNDGRVFGGVRAGRNGEQALSAAELQELFAAPDWRRIRAEHGLPPLYNGISSAAMLAAHVLPYLLPLASERAVARVLAEHEFLQSLCLLDEEGIVPSRATLWHFRRRFSPHFRDALLTVLLSLYLKADSMGLALPFVSKEIPDTPSATPMSLPLDNFSAAVWLSSPGSSLTNKDKRGSTKEAAVQLKFLEGLGIASQPKKHRYGVADEVGFPAKVQLSDGKGAVSELCLTKPSWLYLNTQLMDPLTTIGPSHVKRSYTACNVLVLSERLGVERVLLAERLTGYGKGEFAIPGGKKREDETVQQCAKRELYEETGLRLLVSTPISLIENRLSGRQVVTSVGVLADEYQGVPANREHEQMGPWQWFPLNALPEKLFLPSKWVIDAYLSPTRDRFAWSEIDRPERELRLWEEMG